MNIAPLIKFSLSVLFWITLLFLDYSYNNVFLEILLFLFIILPFIVFYKLECTNCGEKVGETQSFFSIISSHKCKRCGFSLLKFKNKK